MRTTEVLRTALESTSGDKITLGEFLDTIGERAFGFVILILALPNFIPGADRRRRRHGVLVIFVGLQMLAGLEHPWLLRKLRDRGFSRASVEKFVKRLTPLLRWLERICRPRLEKLAEHPGHRVTGFLLVLVGIALALPIPFTNYIFGLLLVVYAVALIERDGIALIVAWIASAGVAVALLSLSHVAFETMRGWF